MRNRAIARVALWKPPPSRNSFTALLRWIEEPSQITNSLPGIWRRRCSRKRTTSSPLNALSCSIISSLSSSVVPLIAQKVIAALLLVEDGALAYRGVGTHHRREHVETALAGEDDRSTFL